MGILDEAIREHLDLKRAHGAEEAEVKDLESEAFGPADRPDAISSADNSISPGSSITTPAGEGDQLDKVFKQETGTSPVPEPSSDAERVEESEVIPAASAEAETRIESTDAAASSLRAPEATVDTPAPVTDEPDAGASFDDREPDTDAGDMLEAERSHLSSYPTEHYDVDAAIAEEDEIDLLSESSLSDELDRALGDSPVEEVSDPEISGEAEIEDEPVMVEPEADPPSSEMERPEPNFDVGPDSRDPKLGVPKEAEPEPEAEFEPEFESTPDEEDSGEESFFDQDDVEDEGADDSTAEEGEDVLEATPDFLEETPEHDRLWFEQKEPKDFDFGD